MITKLPMLGSVLALTACGTCGFPESNLAKIKPGMTSTQVEAILGRPASIEQSETPDQTVTGEVDHYPGSGGEGHVVYVNNVVFKAEFVPTTKS
jgi:hypothetical protein